MEDNILIINKQASALIKQKNYSGALGMLSKCLALLKPLKESAGLLKLYSITYSNLSILYKETGKIKQSIKCLQKLIEVEKRIPGARYNSVNAYLNICSLYSSSQDHEQALRHGLTGLLMLQKEPNLPDKYVCNLVVAYHNVGVEYEFLNRIDEAADCYEKGWELAKTRLGLSHNLTLSIKNSLVTTANHKPKLPEIPSYRTSSQHAYKRSDFILDSIHTGSTSSGVTESRNINTPRYNNDKKIPMSTIKHLNDKLKYKIDLHTQRNNEKNAATLIQAWWRGIRDRKIYKTIKIKNDIKKAALKAKIAYNEFKTLKAQLAKINLPVINQAKSPEKVSNNKNQLSNLETTKKTPTVNLNAKPKKLFNSPGTRNNNRKNSIEALSVINMNRVKPIDVGTTKNNNFISFKSNTKSRYPNTKQLSNSYITKIIKVQSFIRMCNKKIAYLKMKAATIRIQKNFRKYSCMKLFQAILKSIVLIQNQYRLYKKRSDPKPRPLKSKIY
jgi:IQ calmodulin-binding motif/Tetratricopeptide repeat